MIKNLRVVQYSQTHCILYVNDIFDRQDPLFLAIRKQGGKWDPLSRCYCIQISNLQSLYNELAHQNVHIEQPQFEYLRTLQPISHRILLYDPTLFRRYAWFNALFSNLSNLNVEPQKTNKYKRVLLLFFQCNFIQWLSRSVQHLQPYSPSNRTSLTHTFHYITYEQLFNNNISINFQTYSSVILDDADIIFNPNFATYSSVGTLSKDLSKQLIQKYSLNNELVLIINKIPLHRVLDLCYILHWKVFGFDKLKIMCEEVRDCTWMKRRYRKENKHCFKQLMYVLRNTVLNSIDDDNKDKYNRYVVVVEAVDKFKAIDRRYAAVDPKSLFATLHTNQGEYQSKVMNEQEIKYLREVRDTMLVQKMGPILTFIYNLVRYVQVKVGVVIQNYTQQERIEKYLHQNQIKYTHYSNQSSHQHNSQIIIINREKVYRQYKRNKQQYQLNRISYLNHVLFIDTFWFDFSKQKERVMSKIIPQKVIKHFFICKNSYQGSILDQYLSLFEVFVQNQPPEEKEQDNVYDLIYQTSVKYAECQKISFLNIDEQFDRLQYQARKRDRQQAQQVQYNTNISGLQIETPLLNEQFKSTILPFVQNKKRKNQIVQQNNLGIKLTIKRNTEPITIIDIVQQNNKIKRKKRKKKQSIISQDIATQIKKQNILWYATQMVKKPQIIVGIRPKLKIKLFALKSSLNSAIQN